MLHDKRSALSSYVSGLLASGRTVFTAEEAERALGVGRGAFLDAAERLQCRKALPSPRQGFHVVVPPQHASWGTPPPAWYIDGLMRREGQPCYVGLLKAADLHGATHQAVMEFQVVSNKRLPKIRAGRNLIVFCFRKEMEAVGGGNRGPQDRHRHDEDLVGRADGARSAALSAGVRRNRPCRHGPLGPRRKHRSRAVRCPGPSSTDSRYGTRISRPSHRSAIPDGASSCGVCPSATNDPGAEYRREGRRGWQRGADSAKDVRAHASAPCGCSYSAAPCECEMTISASPRPACGRHGHARCVARASTPRSPRSGRR